MVPLQPVGLLSIACLFMAIWAIAFEAWGGGVGDGDGDDGNEVEADGKGEGMDG